MSCDNAEQLSKLLCSTYEMTVNDAGFVCKDMDYVRDICSKVAKHLTSGCCSLYIYGQRGAGKSTLMRALTITLQMIWDGVEGIKVKNFISGTAKRIYEHFAAGNDMYPIFRERELVMIDDLGSEEPTCKWMGTTLTPLESLIKQLSDAHKAMIISSNLTIEEAGKQYSSDRLADCLYQFATIKMNHISFRRL